MELSFNRSNGKVDKTIDLLMKQVEGIHQPEIIREIILSALKAGQENGERADLKLMNATMKEMRFTTKVFSPYRDVKKVTVFGSARTNPQETLYAMARDLGQKLAEAKYMVITGGGPGIMQAVNEGAGPENSFGVNISLPFEQRPNPVIDGNPRYVIYKYFFNRKVTFLKEAHAIAFFPGGFGTLDEAMETFTLVQTGKRYTIPLILIDEPGGTYWKRWLSFLENELLGRGLISQTDFTLFECVESVDHAIAKINHFYRIYHSLRYVGDKLVIRLGSSVDSENIKTLKNHFSDILIPDGAFILSKALPEENDEAEISHLQRLVIDFNREDFGRLRQLIDALNDCQLP